MKPGALLATPAAVCRIEGDLFQPVMAGPMVFHAGITLCMPKLEMCWDVYTLSCGIMA